VARQSAQKRLEAAESVRKNITYLMVLNDKTQPQVAEYLGLSIATTQRKFKDPQRWTLEELISLSNLFNVSVGLIIAGEIRFEKEVLRA
jgi:hypothetical protein